jgi:hypothetical protein
MSPLRRFALGVALGLAVAVLLASPATAVVDEPPDLPTGPHRAGDVGQNQVAIYKVTGVNHVGNMHFAVHWRPTAPPRHLSARLCRPLSVAAGLPRHIPGAHHRLVRHVDLSGRAGTLGADGQPVGDTYYVVIAFNGAAVLGQRQVPMYR